MKVKLNLKGKNHQLVKCEKEGNIFYCWLIFKKADLTKRIFYSIMLSVIAEQEANYTFKISGENINTSFVDYIEFNELIGKDVDCIEFDLEVLDVQPSE